MGGAIAVRKRSGRYRFGVVSKPNNPNPLDHEASLKGGCDQTVPWFEPLVRKRQRELARVSNCICWAEASASQRELPAHARASHRAACQSGGKRMCLLPRALWAYSAPKAGRARRQVSVSPPGCQFPEKRPERCLAVIIGLARALAKITSAGKANPGPRAGRCRQTFPSSERAYRLQSSTALASSNWIDLLTSHPHPALRSYLDANAANSQFYLCGVTLSSQSLLPSRLFRSGKQWKALV